MFLFFASSIYCQEIGIHIICRQQTNCQSYTNKILKATELWSKYYHGKQLNFRLNEPALRKIIFIDILHQEPQHYYLSSYKPCQYLLDDQNHSSHLVRKTDKLQNYEVHFYGSAYSNSNDDCDDRFLNEMIEKIGYVLGLERPPFDICKL